MAKETQEVNVNVDDFLSKLSKDTSSKGENSIERLNLNFNDCKGNYFYILFSSVNGFYKQLNKVKELRAFSIDLGKDTWFEILEKSDYGELDEEEAKLYDEVVRLYAQAEKIDANTENWQNKFTRNKSYCLIYAHVIKFINHDSGVVDKDRVNKPAMMVFPSKKYLEALKLAISTKSSVMGNSSWLNKILSNDPKKREAVITTDFFGGQGGYKCQVSFEMDKDAVKNMLPDNFDFSNEAEYFNKSNIVKDFLRWQAPEGTDKIFNTELFKEIRLRLIDKINPAKEKPLIDQKSTNTPTSTTAAANDSLNELTSQINDGNNLPF